MDHILFIHSPTNGHLGYFCLLGIVNRAAMNIPIQVSVNPNFEFFSYVFFFLQYTHTHIFLIILSLSLLFKTAVFSYNWHTKTCTFLMCTIWCICYMSTPVKLSPHQDSEHNHHPKCFLPPLPLEPLTCFLSVYISLHFLEWHIKGIVQYVAFVSGFFHSA